MVDARPEQAPGPKGRNDAQGSSQPWDYERHLQTEHNLYMEAEAGWPTVVKRYRLFRPVEGKRSERTLAVFVGTSPAAASHFFGYIHPGKKESRATSPMSPRQRPYSGRRG